ncbi:MAG: hypothetical protein A2V83_03870 [Nitrospirae bacterium RBG_16_64_22]|nr:MAG: hypothetical protein A2V83_03870 [Nitrospirae bacterium RBG_16_64_22]
MREIEYLVYLSPEMEDRLRVSALQEQGSILGFVVQYEAFLKGEWRPIVRYDTAHGFSHRDRIRPSGVMEKQPLFFDSYNLALTHASLDLKANWASYRDAYEQEMKE